MTAKSKQVGWIAIAGAVIMIASFLLTNVIAGKPDSEVLKSRVNGLETDVREIRTDVKILLQRIPERR